MVITTEKKGESIEIPVERIDRNPDNPRIVFRPKELQELLESIRRYGVLVPITVYREGRRYVLIDGERRWRCAVKLNKKTIPALVQAKPTPLENLLFMFNIHSLREQWDLLTISLKLPELIRLLTNDLGRTPNEIELSDRSGLSRGVIRRCKLLIDLPNKYRDQLLLEIKKPKTQQRLTEDFFIEMERSLKTIQRAVPGLIKDKDDIRDVLIDKYKKGTIRNVTDFRYLAKIARAERVEADPDKAKSVLKKVFQDNGYSATQAYQDSVSEAYAERDLSTRVQSLLSLLETFSADELDEHVREQLELLWNRLSELLGRRR